jgi:hypothetical protein
MFKWQDPPCMVDGFTDSDWAGCPKTRRSTSGGVLLHGQHLVHHWSSTQTVVALSSMEAELNAIVKGVAEVLGLKNLLEECGRNLEAVIFTDSSAANGVVHRQGSGKVKHLECRQLWVQGAVFNGQVRVEKVARDFNPADAFTHYTSVHDAARHFKSISLIDPDTEVHKRPTGLNICQVKLLREKVPPQEALLQALSVPLWHAQRPRTTSALSASFEGGCESTPSQATLCYMNETLLQLMNLSLYGFGSSFGGVKTLFMLAERA